MNKILENDKDEAVIEQILELKKAGYISMAHAEDLIRRHSSKTSLSSGHVKGTVVNDLRTA